MFERALLNSSPPRKALPLAYTLEAVLVGLLLLAPLIHTRALRLSELRLLNGWIIPPPAPPRARGAAEGPVKRKTPITARDILEARPVLPRFIPDISDQLMSREDQGVGVLGGLGEGIPGGTKDGGIASVLAGLNSPPPPPPQPGKAAKQVPRIRVGGQVIAAKAILQPKPEYPELARRLRVEGTVRLEATIGTHGTIQNLKLLSGHPLLVKAALEAVARWRYQPTLLNGEPVEVVTEIEVNFKLEP